MALVNPNIAMSYRGIELPQQNMLADYATIQQIQGGRQAQELNALKMQEAQRTAKSQNMLADAYAQSIDATGKIDYNKLTGLVAAGGGGAQLPGIQKSRFEQETASTKLLSDRLALLPNAYKEADTPEAYLSLHQSLHADPVVGPWLKSVGATPEKGLATLQNAIQTGKFDDLRLKSMQSVAQLLEGMKPMSVAASSSVYNPQTGTFNQAPAAPVAPAAPPVSVAEFERAKTDPAFMKFLQDRAAATRAPRPEAAPRTQQVTLSDGSLGIVNMDTGVITPSTVGGAAVKGKPSAFAEKTAAQKTQMGKDINLAIKELTDATKDGGLIDQSTGSGAGALADIAAGFVGKATPGAIAIGKLAPIADLALKMIPRFEGPQSDKDTMSYKQAAGQLANASLPNAIRKEAGKTVLRLMQERKNQFGSADMAPSGIAPPAGFTPD